MFRISVRVRSGVSVMKYLFESLIDYVGVLEMVIGEEIKLV